VSFWWSPDGKTIAALRVQPVADGVTGSGAGASAAASAEATASPASSVAAGPSVAASLAPNGSAGPSASQPPSEVRLLFLDVASGRIQSQAIVEPGQLFIDQFLTYFDQYALSHQLWAPDSSALLLPVTEPDGTTHVSVISRNGDPPLSLNGAIAFWSP
jgi:TolB protein